MKKQGKERGVVFGQKCIVSLAKYDQDTRSLKMYQCSLFGEEQELLQILPKSGTIVNGKLSEQTKWELGIEEKESGLWRMKTRFPTPTTQETEHPQAELTKTGRRKTKDGKNSHSLNLADIVRMFPTPTVADTFTDKLKSSQQKEGSMHSVNLSQAVHMKEMFPTQNQELPGS